MCEAVEQHEGADQGAADGGGQFCQGGDEDAGDQYREGDAGFNARQAQAAPGECGAEDHAADYEGRCGVFHGFALAHAPEADGGHGQQVVQAEHGVQQAAGEAAGAVAGVSHGGGGGGQQGGGGKQFGCQFHGLLLVVLNAFWFGRSGGGGLFAGPALGQHAAFKDEGDDFLQPYSVVQVGEHERALAPHFLAVPLHHVE